MCHRGRENLQLVALHDLNFAIALRKARRRIIAKAKKIRREKDEIEKHLDHHLKHVCKIDAYLNFVHPSGEVIFAEWYPLLAPIWVPKLLADKKHTLILDLNGMLVQVVE